MDSLTGLGDLLGMIGFATAILITLLTPSSNKGSFSPMTKGLMVGAFGVYLVVCAIEVFHPWVEGSYFSDLDDYIELLFPVLVLLSVFAAYSAQQMGDLRRAQQAAMLERGMMFDLIDSVPAGVMVLSPAGDIVFANETARDVLDLVDDPIHGDRAPSELVFEVDGEPLESVEQLLQTVPNRPVPVRVSWPSGWRVDLKFRTQQLVEQSGRLGGIVVTFERPEAALGTGRARGA